MCKISHVGLADSWDGASFHTEDMPGKQLRLFIYLNNLGCSLKHPQCFSVVQKRAIQIWQPKSWSLTLQHAFMPRSLHSGWGLQVWNLPGHTGMLIETSGKTDGEFLSPLRDRGREYEIYLFIFSSLNTYLQERHSAWNTPQLASVKNYVCQ